MYVCLSIQKQNNISTVGTALFSTRNFTDFFLLLPFHYPYYKSYKTTATSTELIVIAMANA